MSMPFSWPEWQRLDAVGIASHVRAKRVSAAEVLRQAAAAIEAVDPLLNSVLEVFWDTVESPDLSAKADGALFGVPMLMKDSGSSIKGRLQEWGSRLTAGWRSQRDCPVTRNLRMAGVNLIGRTTLPEAGKAFDTSVDYRGSFVVTRNPWDLSRTPGGSSGGSAAIVAAGGVPVARSGDAAGSTRVPAAFTGLVGHKPTRGLLPPPRGMNELTNHRAQEGVLTRTVRDQAALLDVMIDGFPMAHYIAAKLPSSSLTASIQQPPQRLRIAVSSGAWGLPGTCAPAVQERILEVATTFADACGHAVDPSQDDQLCEWELFWRTVRTNWLTTTGSWWTFAEKEGWSFDRVRAELAPQNASLFDASASLTMSDLRAASNFNPRLMDSLSEFFDRFDVLLCPAFCDPIPEAGGPYSLFSDMPFSRWFDNLLNAMRYTVLSNESGLPSLCLPCGLVDGLPIGFLLYGRPGSDGLLLQLGAQLETSRPDWFNNAPPHSVVSLA